MHMGHGSKIMKQQIIKYNERTNAGVLFERGHLDLEHQGLPSPVFAFQFELTTYKLN